jgi:FtsH-binding integral membrane protein
MERQLQGRLSMPILGPMKRNPVGSKTVERYNTNYQTRAQTQTAEFDEGLRAYMLKVYNYMASGVLLSAILYMVVSQYEPIRDLFFLIVETPRGLALTPTGLGMVAMIAPLGFALVLMFGVHKLSAGATKVLFWAYAACFGISSAALLYAYTDVSIARTFLVTAVAFGGLSLFGYTTKKNLAPMGTFLMMGLIGLLVMSLVSFFWPFSSMMMFIFNVAGVLIFAGLTAFYTQSIKETYYYLSSHNELEKGAALGAFTLYLAFINLFMFLLQFLGNRE